MLATSAIAQNVNNGANSDITSQRKFRFPCLHVNNEKLLNIFILEGVLQKHVRMDEMPKHIEKAMFKKILVHV